MFKLIKQIFILLIIVVAFLIGAQNPQIVTLNYVIASITMPQAMVISLSFSVGLIAGCIISFKVFTSLKWHNYRLKRQTRLAHQKDS
ncbi:MAG: LapA family protein [Pseudoalteromonas tunicata]|nr:LapA family protein [Pseudoalteromonas tunicata]AXT32610.1 LapA family protein [Pseudoalteromonas tunicata]MDP4982306.1 LapA family protein [Pseudoalteromonas tunicata]MDP5212035.1 LapA family protein [Pseudoalteromonas tunicata]